MVADIDYQVLGTKSLLEAQAIYGRDITQQPAPAVTEVSPQGRIILAKEMFTETPAGILVLDTLSPLEAVIYGIEIKPQFRHHTRPDIKPPIRDTLMRLAKTYAQELNKQEPALYIDLPEQYTRELIATEKKRRESHSKEPSPSYAFLNHYHFEFRRKRFDAPGRVLWEYTGKYSTTTKESEAA